MTSRGYEVGLVVSTDVRTLVGIWMGRFPFGEAQRNGKLKLEGPPALQRQFPKWLQLSVFAPA